LTYFNILLSSKLKGDNIKHILFQHHLHWRGWCTCKYFNAQVSEGL